MVTPPQNRGYAARGWDISYTTVPAGGGIMGCGGTLFNTRGVVTAPNFPGNFSRFSDCTWRLRVPAGHRVEVRFTTVSFGTRDNCETDFVEMYDVPTGNAGGRTLASSFCGNVSLVAFPIAGNKCFSPGPGSF
jgi:cubilin